MNFEDSAYYNNAAVSYLKEGQRKQAIDLFRVALKQTMHKIALNSLRSPVDDPTDTVETVRAETHGLDSCEPKHHPQHHNTNITRRPLPLRHPDSNLFVFSQGINLIPADCAYSYDPLVNSTITSSIMLFNLASAYHCNGLEQELGSARFRIADLERARTLYIKSQQLLVEIGVSFGSTGNPVLDVLAMSVLNNLAQLHHELRLYEESRENFDCLVQFALSINPSRYGDYGIAIAVDQHRTNFLLNAIILKPPITAAAA